MTDGSDPSAIRDAVVTRYSLLAQLARSGGRPLDCDPGCDDGFGDAAYDQADAPEAALRASLGCGDPLTVADLHEGETVLDLGSGGGLDVLLSARRVGPTGHAYGLDPGRRAAAEQRLGCTTGTLTADRYRQLLTDAGFADIAITPTADAGSGLHAATVRATKPR